MANELKSPPSPTADVRSPGHERQSEPRYPLAVHIEVDGIDRCGQPFCEKTFTINVSHRGCRFMLHRELAKDSIVAIRVVSTLSGDPPHPQFVMFQIMYTKQEKEGWVMGGWTLQPDIEWCSDIPKRSESNK
jgi:hypothetical protein